MELVTSLIDSHEMRDETFRGSHLIQDKLIRSPLSVEFSDTNYWKVLSLSAPAGYGKSTFAKQLIHEKISKDSKTQCVRIGFDSLSNSISYFLSSFCRALQSEFKSLSDSLLKELEKNLSNQPENMVTLLLNYFDLNSNKVIWIFDDIHELEHEKLLKILSVLIKNLPVNHQIILISRSNIPFALQGYSFEENWVQLNADDLKFSKNQTVQFLNKYMGEKTSEEIGQLIYEKTQGWIAGIQLMALALKTKSIEVQSIQNFNRPTPQIFDYFLSEVLNHIDSEKKEFLIECAILSELNKEICFAITQNSNSEKWLNEFAQQNLFLTKDWDHDEYRFHPLFSEVMLKVLQQEQPLKLDILYQRAAAYYHSKNRLLEAYQYAIEGKDWERVEMLSEQVVETLFKSSNFISMHDLLERLPKDLEQTLAFTEIFKVWVLFHQGKEAEGAVKLEKISLFLEDSQTKITSQKVQIIKAHVHLLYANILRLEGKLSQAISSCYNALSTLPHGQFFLECSLLNHIGICQFLLRDWAQAEKTLLLTHQQSAKHQHHLAYYGSIYTLCEIYGLSGRLHKANELIDQSINEYSPSDRYASAPKGYSYLAQSRMLYRCGQITEAFIPLASAMEAGQAGGNIRILNYCHSTLGHLYRAQREYESMSFHYKKGLEYSHKNKMNWAIDEENPRLHQHYLQLINQKPDSLYLSVKSIQQKCSGDLSLVTPEEFCLWIHFLFSKEKYDDLIREIDQYFVSAQESPTENIYHQLQLKVFYFLALFKLEKFEDSFEIAQNTFGAISKTGLSGVLSIDSNLGFKEFWLSYQQNHDWTFDFNPPEDCHSVAIENPSEQLLADLSPRELEVLNALCLGQSNKEIAEILYVAPSTVKTHLKNIFGKLGVKNRTHAITLASSFLK